MKNPNEIKQKRSQLFVKHNLFFCSMTWHYMDTYMREEMGLFHEALQNFEFII